MNASSKMTSMQPNRQPPSAKRSILKISKCSPISVLGLGLIVTQLLIFNVGVRFSSQPIVNDSPSSLTAVHTVGDSSSAGGVAGRQAQETDAQSQHGRAQRQPLDFESADAVFHGYPVQLKERKHAFSVSHCVGENYQESKAWMERSCKFSFLCFDVKEKEFSMYQPSTDADIYEHLEKRPFIDVTQSYMKQSVNKTNTMSLGGINQKWTWKPNGIPRLEWSPQIKTPPIDESLSFYELPRDVVMVPFHSLNGGNPGHLVWDDFLPIYTLLTMFDLEKEKYLLPIRYVLKGDRGLWASCDFKKEKTETCAAMQKKFLPLMVGLEYQKSLATTEQFEFLPALGKELKSNLVCSRHAAAGLGGITDHGTKKSHGWELADYEITHNHGRGGQLYSFRNFMLTNIGVNPYFKHKPPFRIVFSENSSDVPNRVIDFHRQIKRLQAAFNPDYVSIESYVFKELTLQEQMEIASQTSIFVTGCGGGAVTGMFLPKGASLLLYYVENGGVSNNIPTGTPARLDWDLFNNLAYIRTHWLPRKSMPSHTDLDAFVLLVRHELDGLLRENSYDYWF